MRFYGPTGFVVVAVSAVSGGVRVCVRGAAPRQIAHNHSPRIFFDAFRRQNDARRRSADAEDDSHLVSAVLEGELSNRYFQSNGETFQAISNCLIVAVEFSISL